MGLSQCCDSVMSFYAACQCHVAYDGAVLL